MKKKTLAIVLCTMLYMLTFSQDSKRNVVYAEAIGVTGTYSINYERVLTRNSNLNISLRGGLAYLFGNEEFNSSLLLPLSTSVLKSLENGHKLELRLSYFSAFYYDYRYTYYTHHGGSTHRELSDKKEFGWGGTPGLAFGYRYQPSDKRLFANLLYQTSWFFDDQSWYKHLSFGIGISF